MLPHEATNVVSNRHRERSNPEVPKKGLDCFVTLLLAMTSGLA
jgi:hypothetical protein